MQKIMILLAVLLSTVAFAEYDAVYCGLMLDGKKGKDRGHPEAILAVKYRIVNGDITPWDEGYAALWAMSAKHYEFAQRAINGSEKNGTIFCVNARWSGASYSSWNINAISLRTDSVYRIDHMSSF